MAETTASVDVEFVAAPLEDASSWTVAEPVSAARSVEPSAESPIGPTPVNDELVV